MSARQTREQAVELVGEDAVRRVETENCDFSHRVVDDGRIEFSASIQTELLGELSGAEAGDDVTLVAYFFQDAEDIARTADLSDLDWTATEFMVIAY